jgi:hypothetical protein
MAANDIYQTASTTTTWVTYPVADLFVFLRLELAIMDSGHDQKVLWYVGDKYTYLKINYLKNKIQIPKKYQKMFIGRTFPIGG